MTGVSKIACTGYVFSILWLLYLTLVSYVDYSEDIAHDYDSKMYRIAKTIVESMPEDAFAKATAATMVLVIIGVMIENAY